MVGKFNFEKFFSVQILAKYTHHMLEVVVHLLGGWLDEGHHQAHKGHGGQNNSAHYKAEHIKINCVVYIYRINSLYTIILEFYGRGKLQGKNNEVLPWGGEGDVLFKLYHYLF